MNRKRKREVLSHTDRISQLPRPILHHILSFLRTIDVVRTGILSKTWYQTSTSFPISDFCLSLVGPPRGDITMEERIHNFVEFVRKSLQSQSRIYGTIPKFNLSMIQHSPIVEDCIQLAIQNNVKDLKIKGKHRLMMPQTLLSAKELILLKLSGCHLPPPTSGVPTWPFLRKLCLEGCRVDGRILQNLTFSCPLLECLLLPDCDELPDISLSGLTKLTEVHIARKCDDDTRVIMVALHLPSLESFSLSDRGHCHVDLTACKNLTTLNLRHSRPMLSSQDLTKLIAGLPALKKLRLCWGSHRIRFSSQQLEFLDLSADELVETDLTDLIAGLPSLKNLCLQCKCKLKRVQFSSEQLEDIRLQVFELVEVRIDAPSLKTFYLFCSKELLSDLFMGRSSPQEVNIFYKGPLNFLKLRKILGGFKQIKLLKLWLNNPDKEFLLPAGFMGIPPLPDIKHLSIPQGLGYREAEDCMALLNELLWNCRPDSISIHKEYSKVFCEELSKMVKGRDGLRSFKIKQAGGHGHADASFISCDEFLELLPTLTSESKVEIHFMLEWYGNGRLL